MAGGTTTAYLPAAFKKDRRSVSEIFSASAMKRSPYQPPFTTAGWFLQAIPQPETVIDGPDVADLSCQMDVGAGLFEGAAITTGDDPFF
jgi:hypothetical protein